VLQKLWLLMIALTNFSHRLLSASSQHRTPREVAEISRLS